MRWALVIHFLKLIAVVAIWVGAAVWLKKMSPPTHAPNIRMFDRVVMLVAAGSLSALVVLLDRKGAWAVLRTGALISLGAALGLFLFSARPSDEPHLGAALFGAVIGLIASQWLSQRRERNE